MDLLRSLALLYGALVALLSGAPQTHYHDFTIKETNVTRLCKTKTILTVNGQYPGPTIYARKGDRIVVNVRNEGHKNITLHWHGVAQPRNPWHDGPAYVTQCPIRPGKSFTYSIQLTEEEGTLWWHAHTDYDRATVHGAIAIRPRRHDRMNRRLPPVDRDFPVILGEWYNGDMEKNYDDAMRTGGGLAFSDANTINGQPGDLAPCSNNETFKIQVETGKTYLLRLISAGMDDAFFFAVAGHLLTVIATDASYVEPFTTHYVRLHPGQTMDVLLTANASSGGRYYMAARPFQYTIYDGLDNMTATAIIEYSDQMASDRRASYHEEQGFKIMPIPLPELPCIVDIQAAFAEVMQLRSLVDDEHPVNIPRYVDRHFLITAAVNEIPCPLGMECLGIDNAQMAFSLNNVSLALPSISILDAYYSNITGVYSTDFPEKPPFWFNFTAEVQPQELLLTRRAMKVAVLEYNVSVEIVFQSTTLVSPVSHPMHFHGHSFYVVGYGTGNFNKEKDTLRYNLVDPPYVNTVVVPGAGWAAIRFRSTNPGVWFMHCHYGRHLSWGLGMVFIVKDGEGPDARMQPPPADMPTC